MYLSTLVTSVEDALVLAINATIEVQGTLTTTILIASLIFLSTVPIATRPDAVDTWIDTRALRLLYTFRVSALPDPSYGPTPGESLSRPVVPA